MAIPFFSIDFRKNEFSGLLKGLLPFGGQKPFDDLTSIIQKDFPDREVLLFPSARMAFYLTLQSMFKAGDEIIFPVLGFPLYVKIAVQLGLIPRLVDVEPGHLTMDPEKLRQAITDKTRGIVVTHLFGHPADMQKIMAFAGAKNIPVIEDCAQSYDTFLNDRPTGTFGEVGIFSCSLMKVPTTLGGGILVTKDKALASRIRGLLDTPEYRKNFSVTFSFFIKNTISVLNSFSLLYTLLSHQVFGLIKNRNPVLLRKILYSGMGLSGGPFKVWERPPLAGYQARVGCVQFPRTREMTLCRREYSRRLNAAVEGIPGILILREEPGVFWNYQYHVIGLEHGMEQLFDALFTHGVHVMQENVWDCSAYDFYSGTETFPVGSRVNKGLIRIPNNSFLSPKQVARIASLLKECCGTISRQARG